MYINNIDNLFDTSSDSAQQDPDKLLLDSIIEMDEVSGVSNDSPLSNGSISGDGQSVPTFQLNDSGQINYVDSLRLLDHDDAGTPSSPQVAFGGDTPGFPRDGEDPEPRPIDI